MPIFTQGLIAFAYLALAGGAVFALANWGGEMGAPYSAAVGAAIALTGALIHGALARSRRDRLLADMLRTLHRSQTSIAKGMTVLREELRELVALADETRANLPGRGYGELAAEMRVLETLLRQATPEKEGAFVGRRSRRAVAGPSAPPRDVRDDEVLDLIHDALEHSRIDVYLQPVVSLPQRKLTFYETFSRLRSPEGAEIEPAKYLAVAERTGLITAIDNNLLFRCVQLVRRAQRRNLKLGFFCNISPHTLRDTSFFPEFIDFMERNERLAPSLVFEFAQTDFASHDGGVRTNLGRLADMGFRFSIDQIETLELDVRELVDRRVSFLKVKAEALLVRLADGDAGLDVHCLLRMLDRAGIYLIVEKIESEAQVVELLDYGIDFGQGYLFGAPRLSREGE